MKKTLIWFSNLKKHRRHFIILFAMLLSIVIGALIIIMPICYQFFKTAMARQLPQNVIKNNNYFILGFSIFMFLLWFYIFVYTLRTILYTRYGVGSLPEKGKIIRYLTNLINKSINNFYNLVEKLPGMSWFYENMMKPFMIFLIRRLNTRKRLGLIALMLDFLPKFVFLCVFSLDVYYYHQFYFIYKVIFILILPLFERYLKFWLNRYTEESRFHYDLFLRVVDRDDWSVETYILVYFNLFLVEECGKAFNDGNYKFETQCPLYKDNNIVILTAQFSRSLAEEEEMTGEEIFEVLEVLTHKWQNEHCPLIIFGDFYNLFHYYYAKYFSLIQAYGYTLTWLWIIGYIL